ncbi:MAG: peptide ABC transporter substrate-binding protein [Undibacterium sp.]|nr:peptide ABC transporter substrate-binding protein [Opitutaceae bacterium]
MSAASPSRLRLSRLFAFFAGPLLLSLLISACGKKPTPSAFAPASGDTPRVLRISQRNEPADLDPATATLPDEFFIIRALSESLVVPSADGGTPRPAAAARWDISSDGLTYAFHLRPEARWSNGDSVTAGDFIASYRRLLTPATAAPKANLFYAVKNARAFATGALTDFSSVGFAAPDTHTLVITLERPTPAFLIYVSSGPWIPIHPATVTKHGRAWTQPAHYVGNGAFTLAEWRQQQRIVVKKNPAYRAAATVRLDEIQFLRFDSGDTEERAYRAGQLDVTMSIPQSKIAAYAKDNPAEFHRAPLAETRFLSFNTRRPALADPRVRRALALTVDRKRIVERVELGGQAPAWRLTPPTILLATDSAFTSPLRDDPAEARRLLAEAGFPGGKNFPKLELSAWSRSQASTLEALQGMWRQELGLEVAVTIREAKIHFAAMNSGDFDIGYTTTTTLLDVKDAQSLLANFASTAPDNYPHWQSPDFDRHLATATAAPTARTQATALAAAELQLLESAAIAPLYFNTHNWLMTTRVKGWSEDALWSRDYTGVSLAP